MKKVSLQFIAEQAGVSKSLVSKVLNNKEVRVSDATRQRILDIAKQYIYTPNRMATGLRTSKTNLIGCIIPELNTDFFMKLVDSIEKHSRNCGYELILCNTRESVELERRYLELYKSGMIEGMIVMPVDNEENRDLYQRASEEEFPMVFADRYMKGLNASFVATDGYKGTRMLTEELIACGHSNILYVSYEKSVNTSVQIERYQGYKDVMIEHGFLPQSTLCEENLPIEQQGLFKELTKQGRATALVLVASLTINSVLEICHALDMCIPDNIEIATFDHFSLEYSDSFNMKRTQRLKKPPFVMEQDTEAIGRCAVEMLRDMIATGNIPRRSVFILPKLCKPPENS